MKHDQTILFKITSCYITLPLKITFYAKTENKILTFSVLLQAEMNLAQSYVARRNFEKDRLVMFHLIWFSGLC
jgi:hypothetical protein